MEIKQGLTNLPETVRLTSPPSKIEPGQNPGPAVPAPQRDDDHLTAEQDILLKRALNFCLLVYGPLDAIAGTLSQVGYTKIRKLDRGAMQGICFTDTEFAYLVFRGTNSLIDADYDITAVPFFWPLRHYGFEASWRYLRPLVIAWLDELDLQNLSLVVTGHSLGGALAQLAAFDLAQVQHRISNVITFGAPKAFFLCSARRYDETAANIADSTLGKLTFCIVNQRDLIARVPPKWWGYRDVGRGILIDRDDKLHVGAKIESSLLDILSEILDVEQNAPAISLPAVPLQTQPIVRRNVSPPPGLSPAPHIWKAPAPPSPNWGKMIIDVCFPVARIIPLILLPLYYVRAVLGFGSAGANHLSIQYVRAFFGAQEPPIPYAVETVWWRKLPRLIIGFTLRLVLGALLLAGLFWTCWLVYKSLRR